MGSTCFFFIQVGFSNIRGLPLVIFDESLNPGTLKLVCKRSFHCDYHSVSIQIERPRVVNFIHPGGGDKLCTLLYIEQKDCPAGLHARCI